MSDLILQKKDRLKLQSLDPSNVLIFDRSWAMKVLGSKKIIRSKARLTTSWLAGTITPIPWEPLDMLRKVILCHGFLPNLDGKGVPLQGKSIMGCGDDLCDYYVCVTPLTSLRSRLALL